jgi:hypothetical protein
MTWSEIKTRPGGFPVEPDQQKSAEISTDIEVCHPDDLGPNGVNEARTDSKIDKHLTASCSRSVPELRRHLKMLQTTSPVLRHHLSTLDDMLKSWDAGGNRLHLAGNIERTILAIETLQQPAA